MDYEALLKASSDEPEHMYRTERGSTYAHYKDNTTVRNRSGAAHKDTSTGVQPRSGKTIYMDPKDVNRMAGVFQNSEMATKFVPSSYDKETGIGKGSLVLTEDYGPKKAGTILHEASFTMRPSVGANPVEIFRSESPKGDSGRGIHWGNKITEVRGMGGGSRDLQLGADLDPKAMMKKYAGGGAIQMPQTYSDGNWKLI
jgi:hypothetical protein